MHIRHQIKMKVRKARKKRGDVRHVKKWGNVWHVKN